MRIDWDIYRYIEELDRIVEIYHNTIIDEYTYNMLLNTVKNEIIQKFPIDVRKQRGLNF